MPNKDVHQIYATTLGRPLSDAHMPPHFESLVTTCSVPRASANFISLPHRLSLYSLTIHCALMPRPRGSAWIRSATPLAVTSFCCCPPRCNCWAPHMLPELPSHMHGGVEQDCAALRKGVRIYLCHAHLQIGKVRLLGRLAHPARLLRWLLVRLQLILSALDVLKS